MLSYHNIVDTVHLMLALYFLSITKMYLFIQVITKEMEEFMEKLKQKVVVGIVGGSDLNKIKEQMNGEKCEIFLSSTWNSNNEDIFVTIK